MCLDQVSFELIENCEYSEIFKNIFFYRTPLVAASVMSRKQIMLFTHSISISELRNSYNGYFLNIKVNKNTE